MPSMRYDSVFTRLGRNFGAVAMAALMPIMFPATTFSMLRAGGPIPCLLMAGFGDYWE